MKVDSLLLVREFLVGETPSAWIEAAVAQQETLLIDHANCEKKAASTALNLIYRYVDHFGLLNKMRHWGRGWFSCPLKMVCRPIRINGFELQSRLLIIFRAFRSSSAMIISVSIPIQMLEALNWAAR